MAGVIDYEKNRIYQARYRNSPKGKTRSRRNGLKRLYGLSLETYEQKLKEQHGMCALCDVVPAPGRALSVDHNHATGEVRGLLCQACNIALGYYERKNRHIAFQAYLDAYDG